MRLNLDDVFKGLETLEQKVTKAVEIYADSTGMKLEAQAKENAKWIDRTGKARQTITHSSKWIGPKMRIAVEGNTPYSIWLELANEKRFAILNPTLLANCDDILSGMHNLLER